LHFWLSHHHTLKTENKSSFNCIVSLLFFFFGGGAELAPRFKNVLSYSTRCWDWLRDRLVLTQAAKWGTHLNLKDIY
jgi:hypothetical protein